MTNRDFTDVVEKLHRQETAIKMLTDGADKIRSGGVAGIQEAAQTHPQLILDSIEGLVDAVRMLQKGQVDLCEELMTVYDTHDIPRPKKN